jgi:hypothetical protein
MDLLTCWQRLADAGLRGLIEAGRAYTHYAHLCLCAPSRTSLIQG